MDPKPHGRHLGECLCGNDNVSTGRRRCLVVAFDGTQNQFGPESSHVVEFYSRIVKSDDQLSYYTSGIGTFVKPESFASRTRMWIKNGREAMVGSNFTSNILSGYRFLSDNYKTGDQMFLLGFSRGAYQARVLAAMITKVGLLCTGNDEQIPFAFEIYADKDTSKKMPKDRDRPERGPTTAAEEFQDAFCRSANIHFVGVWDTVSSVGIWYNKYYPGAERAENICFFRHALALDERRVKFLPEYVVAEKEWFLASKCCRPICKEVWFRGSHSDVGGGNVHNLSCDGGAIPSRWMAYEAMLAGLEMKPFWDGIKVKNLEPNEVFNDSMTRFYTLLEYTGLLINWEDHSESRPPLLTDPTDKGKAPQRLFSRAWHRKRPRQIYDHQKLHASVCLHKQKLEVPEVPIASLPQSWTDKPGGPYGWKNVINLLRIQEDEATDASGRLLRFIERELRHRPSDTGNQREALRYTVIGAKNSLRKPRSSSTGSLRRERGHQSPTNLESAPGGHVTSGSYAAEDDPADPITRDAEFTLPPEAIELDLLDCDVIPMLIAGMVNGVNVMEFLERLQTLAYTDDGKGSITKEAIHKFIKVVEERKLENKPEYAELAINIAYEAYYGVESTPVDLYATDIELWRAILFRVQNWNGLPTASPAFLKAVRLIHKTKSQSALDEINEAVDKMFDQRPRSSTERQNAIQTVETCWEWDATFHILRLAVSASPHFSDSEFTETLVKYLTGMIRSAVHVRQSTLGTLCLCVLCAIDERWTLSRELSSLVNSWIERSFPFLIEMWSLVEKHTFPTRLSGELKTSLRDLILLPRFASAIKECDHSWALAALDQALPHQNPSGWSGEEPDEYELVYNPENRPPSIARAAAAAYPPSTSANPLNS